VKKMIPKNSETHLILSYRHFIFHGGAICTYPCGEFLSGTVSRMAGTISNAKFDVARDTEV